MELRVLRYFLTVAQEGNITKAADILHVTQPTLSRQLMDLEAELGTTLFIRGKRAITLTDDGHLLRQRAQEIVELAEKTQREFTEQREEVRGVGYAFTLNGSLAMRSSDKTKFIPLSPQRTAESVFIWKKNHMFHPAATLFLQQAKQFVSDENTDNK